MNKQEARKTAKAAVGAWSARERFGASLKIAENFAGFIKPLDVKTAFVYMSVAGEPSTFTIISNLLLAGVKVFIPKLRGDDMLLTEVKADTTYCLNDYGVPETFTCGAEKYDADINIIPLVAYDKNRNRAGHGKGYYDKYLEKATGKNIALAFSSQEVDTIETEGFDVKPDVIITEKGIVE